MGDVFKIVGCSAISQPSGFDGRKHHPVTALHTGEHEAGQAGLRNVRAVHGTISVPVPRQAPRDQFIEESTDICAPHKIYAAQLAIRHHWRGSLLARHLRAPVVLDVVDVQHPQRKVVMPIL
jgi:hypothetical protein